MSEPTGPFGRADGGGDEEPEARNEGREGVRADITVSGDVSGQLAVGRQIRQIRSAADPPGPGRGDAAGAGPPDARVATSDESEASAPPTVDFFISYAAADRARAEWIARQLQGAGYRVLLQAWHFRPGDNFVVRMMESLEAADRIVAVISQAYLDSPYGQDEWTSAFVRDESGRNRLLCVRIENCRLPRLLATRVYVDLTDVDEATARARLLAAAGS